MVDHLRYAGADAAVQHRALVELIQSDVVLMTFLRGMDELGLPDPLLGSGIIYNTVWNVLTGRPQHRGVNDVDIAYFDPSDRSYEAEDDVIRRVQSHFAGSPFPVQVRNQARVHLWFPDRFGLAYPELTCSSDMLRYFATKTHAVAARLKQGEVVVYAPFGLDDLFSFRLRPNPVLSNRMTHERKGARALTLWPELRFEPWPG